MNERSNRNKEYVSDSDGMIIMLPVQKNSSSSMVPVKSDENLQKHLAKQAAALIQEYSKMKNFILEIYLKDRLTRENYSKTQITSLRNEIEKEMQVFLQEALSQSVRIQNPGGSALEKDLVSLELSRTIEALEARIGHYRLHYVSHNLQNRYAGIQNQPH